MKVLMLSTDQAILQAGSGPRQRMQEYAASAVADDELHIVVYNRFQDGAQQAQREGRLYVYPMNLSSKLFYFKTGYGIAKRILKSGGQWVITTQDPFETGLLGFLLKKQFKIPLQMQVHTDFLSPWFGRESLKNKIRVWLGKWLVKKADGLRVVSERIRNSLLHLSPIMAAKPINVLSINVDVKKLRAVGIKTDLHQKYPQFPHLLLLPARFTVEKNIALAIEAMRIVKQKFSKPVGLILVGDGPQKQELGDRIKDLGLESTVIIEGWTTDIVSYYKTADVMLLTSNYEGGARAPAEAAAVGLPVIMTDVAPANEYIQNGVNGFVVPVGDYSVLADKIVELLANPDRQRLFKKEALKISDAFYDRNEYLKRMQSGFTSLLSANI